jgi:uncharacterized surface protein with fasciclin (FAS1) repeats
MRRLLSILTAGLLALAIAAPVAAAKPAAKGDSILDVAIAANASGPFAGQLDTLIAAVLAADPAVATTLDGVGRYTVFAPTDDAFAKIPSGTLSALVADRAALTDVLLYHVAKGSRYSGDVVGSTQIRMLDGEFAKITTDGQSYFIDGAKIIVVDIPASNGVIHVIDTVMLP